MRISAGCRGLASSSDSCRKACRPSSHKAAWAGERGRSSPVVSRSEMPAGANSSIVTSPPDALAVAR